MVNMKTNTWSPDTCICKISFQWDRDLPEDQRVHTWKETLITCPEHSGQSGAALYDTVLTDNQRKNKVEGFLTITFDELVNIITEKDGKITRTLLKGMEWSFSGNDTNRVLTVDLSGTPLKNNQKNTIQNFADQTFGTGKVVII